MNKCIHRTGCNSPKYCELEGRCTSTAPRAAESRTAPDEPVAWIEHHKAGDNLNWDRVDHPYAKATPLYRAAPSLTQSEIREAVARGWCWERNEHKEMDSDLATAIADEVGMALRAKLREHAEREGK